MEPKTESKTPAQLKPIDVFSQKLNLYRNNIRDLLNAHKMSEQEFIVTVVNSVKKIPALLECDQSTLFGAVLTSAELGLPPNTPMQLSFIIPYNNRRKIGNEWVTIKEAQFQIGYQGWIEIMLRNPKIESIDSGVVHENEEWHFNKGLREPFSHKPLPPSKRGMPIGTYAIAWIKDSDKPKVVFLYKEEIDQFMKISQGAASDKSPWKDVEKDPQKWMWRKTAIKQLSKELPKTKEQEKAYIHDNVVEMGGNQTIDAEGTVVIVENEELKAQEILEKSQAKNAAANAGAANDIHGEKKK